MVAVALNISIRHGGLGYTFRITQPLRLAATKVLVTVIDSYMQEDLPLFGSCIVFEK